MTNDTSRLLRSKVRGAPLPVMVPSSLEAFEAVQMSVDRFCLVAGNHLMLTEGSENVEQEFDNTGLGKFLKDAVDDQSHSLVHVYRLSDLANVFNPGGANGGGTDSVDEDGLKKKPGQGLEEALEELKAQLAEDDGGFDIDAGTLREQILLALRKEAGQEVEMDFADSDDGGSIDTEAIKPEEEEQVGPPELVNRDPTRTVTAGGENQSDLDRINAMDGLPEASSLDTSSAPPGGQAGQTMQQPAAAAGTPATASTGDTTRTQWATTAP